MDLVTKSGKESSPVFHVEEAVRDRYSAASQAVQPALCCPVKYDPKFLEVLPAELVERDYGCGDPSKFVRAGETVLDLGSGGGKICYIASQIVGPQGRVIGVDMNDDMLALARRYQTEIGNRIGWQNVSFFKGRIQDLALNLEQFETRLSQQPIQTANDWLAAERFADELRQIQPMIPDNSVDVVLSNCVLNLVSPTSRQQLFAELFRVLKVGGRAAISDIVSDRPVPASLRDDPELWSGCISGSFVEDEFLRAFEAAGFHGLEVVERQAEPWAVLEGVQFRSVTVRAFKGVHDQTNSRSGEVLYRGPWASVTDETGLTLKRGCRTTVNAAAQDRFAREPYSTHLISLPATPTSEQRQLNVLPLANCCGPGECC